MTPVAKATIPDEVVFHYRALRLQGLKRFEAAAEILDEPGVAEELDRDVASFVSAMDKDARTTIRAKGQKYTDAAVELYAEMRRRGLTGLRAAEVVKIRLKMEEQVPTIRSCLGDRAGEERCRRRYIGQLLLDAVAPFPGSLDAVREGCRCPVDDNDHGYGWLGGKTREKMFIVRIGCPIHNKEGRA